MNDAAATDPATLTKGFGALLLLIAVSLTAGAVMLICGGFIAHLAWAFILIGWHASPLAG